MNPAQPSTPPAPLPEDRLWTVGEVAHFLAVSESWVYQAARSRAIPSVRVGSAVRFDPSAIRAYVRGETGGKVVQLPRCR